MTLQDQLLTVAAIEKATTEALIGLLANNLLNRYGLDNPIGQFLQAVREELERRSKTV